MARPQKVTQKEYDDIRSKMEAYVHYDTLSDEKKAKFDEEFDKALVVDENADKPDSPDEMQNKDDIDNGHPPAPDDPEGDGRDDDDDLDLE